MHKHKLVQATTDYKSVNFSTVQHPPPLFLSGREKEKMIITIGAVLWSILHMHKMAPVTTDWSDESQSAKFWTFFPLFQGETKKRERTISKVYERCNFMINKFFNNRFNSDKS